MNAITDSIVVNGSIHSGSYEPTAGVLHHGDITAAGLERVEARRLMYQQSDATRSVLLAVAGMSKDDIAFASPPQSQKEMRRGNLISNARKYLAPETLFPQLCKGAALRAIDTNTAAWLAQQIVNQVCDLAITEIIRRRQANGLIEGFNLTKDDREMWIGIQATNTDDMDPALDNRSTDNVFSEIDDPGMIEATFKEWYLCVEPALRALALASIVPNNGIMLHGEFSKWVETINGAREQIILTFEQRLQDRILVANDRAIPQTDPDDAIWSKFQ